MPQNEQCSNQFQQLGETVLFDLRHQLFKGGRCGQLPQEQSGEEDSGDDRCWNKHREWYPRFQVLLSVQLLAWFEGPIHNVSVDTYGWVGVMFSHLFTIFK